jgi:hypothetical protein
MKTTKLISGVVSILVLLAFTLSYAEEEKAYIPKDDEEIYGTGVNTDYSLAQMQKMIVKPIEIIRFSSATDESSYQYMLTFTIIDKWTDSEGNIWYRTENKDTFGLVYYVLYKVSSSGSILEYVWSHYEYPTEIDPNHVEYRIFHRK